MPDQLTKQGALQVSSDLDRLATLFQSETDTLGVTEKIAKDFALRCDILADHVEKKAGVERDEDGTIKDPDLNKYASALSKRAQMDPTKNISIDHGSGFNPAEIGEEQSKALLRNQDEPYMDVFKQDEFDQLREVQQNGMFSNAKSAAAVIAKMAKLLSDNNIKFPVAVG